jgi:type 1 glutamine amidotransferase
MKHIIDYLESGKPILALRTSTHAFRIPKGKKYSKYDWRSSKPKGGFGREVLGETWVAHYGRHKVQSTRGLIAKGMEKHPIVQGCEDIWGPSDVYMVRPLPGTIKPLVMGQVLTGMKPTDKPAPDKQLIPIAWIKSYAPDPKSDKKNRIFVTTMGHGGDLKSEGLRRLLVNGSLWCLGMEDKIPKRAKVDIVGEYNPAPIGVGRHKRGIKPSDLKMGL